MTKQEEFDQSIVSNDIKSARFLIKNKLVNPSLNNNSLNIKGGGEASTAYKKFNQFNL